MLGNPMLEIAIALGFFYLVLSLVCSACTEAISNFLSLRARGLRASISRMFDEDAGGVHSGRLLEHPLIRSLAPRRYWKAVDRVPDYLPSHVFARVLLDVLPGEGQEAKRPTTAGELRELAGKAQPEALRKTLLAILPDDGDLDVARERIESWYDSVMDRARGWYSRRAHWITVAAAVVVVGAINADTVMMTEVLWKNGNLRAVVVAEAEHATAGGTSQGALNRVEVKEALSLFPLGWHGIEDAASADPRVPPTSVLGLFRKLIGLLLTAMAVSLGAPFWFDLLNRLVNLRSAGKPLPTASDKEASTASGR